jgi:hypothetical protein
MPVLDARASRVVLERRRTASLGRESPIGRTWPTSTILIRNVLGLSDRERSRQWARFGADGFRCDVASLVPVEFWVRGEAATRVGARTGLAETDPLAGRERAHRTFVTECRRHGLYAASDPELHAAFDITYDYDGREHLEAAWRGRALPRLLPQAPRGAQEALYPADAVKLRFLENHDQEQGGRALRPRARDCGTGHFFRCFCRVHIWPTWARSSRWSAASGIFDSEPMKADEKENPSFRPFFAEALVSDSRRIKTEAPFFDAAASRRRELCSSSGTGGPRVTRPCSTWTTARGGLSSPEVWSSKESPSWERPQRRAPARFCSLKSRSSREDKSAVISSEYRFASRSRMSPALHLHTQ